jgi:ribose 1,5-bisphosphokinase
VADDGSSDEGRIVGLGPGQIILIVGPSGAGKDAILGEVSRRLVDAAQFLFPRRVVTRQPSAAEDHDCISALEFAARLQEGRFALNWQAHGLNYGIPIEIDAAVRRGECVVCNASRTIVAPARRRYCNAAVVLIDAPPELRAKRLANRRRERQGEVAARLARATDFKAADADLIIENTGTLTAAAATLVDWLWRRCLSPPRH